MHSGRGGRRDGWIAVWVRLPVDLHDQLLRQAAADYDSVSHIVRLAVARHLRPPHGQPGDGVGPLPLPGRARDLERAE